MIRFIITLVTSFLAVGAVYNFVPLKYFEITGIEPQLGSTITTILGTDRLTDSRAVINANFSNLNTDKLENNSYTSQLTVSSSTIAFLRAGYITATSTTGSTFGGTLTTTGIVSTGSATSTFSGGISLAGLASSKGITIASGFGALNSLSTATSSLANGISIGSGCYLTPAGTCLGSLDLSASNIWTSASTTFTQSFQAGSTTIQKLIVGDAISIPVMDKIAVSRTDVAANDTASTTLLTTTIPANILGTDNAITGVANLSNIIITANQSVYFELQYGGTSIFTLGTTTFTGGQFGNGQGQIRFSIYSAGATNSQEINMTLDVQATPNDAGVQSQFVYVTKTTTASIDSTLPQTLTLVWRGTTGGVYTTLTDYMIYAIK